MASRPRSTALFTVFKVLAVTLVVVNVIWHGLVALFIGGPFGFGVFMVGVAAVWGWSWSTMRRLNQASADEPARAIPKP